MGAISILAPLFKEVGLAMIGKLFGKVIVERFMTRVVVYGLSKLKSYSTNDVVDATVDDVIALLKNKKLKVIDDVSAFRN
jgi:hypothetical protein